MCFYGVWCQIYMFAFIGYIDVIDCHRGGQVRYWGTGYSSNNFWDATVEFNFAGFPVNLDQISWPTDIEWHIWYSWLSEWPYVSRSLHDWLYHVYKMGVDTVSRWLFSIDCLIITMSIKYMKSVRSPIEHLDASLWCYAVSQDLCWCAIFRISGCYSMVYLSMVYLGKLHARPSSILQKSNVWARVWPPSDMGFHMDIHMDLDI